MKTLKQVLSELKSNKVKRLPARLAPLAHDIDLLVLKGEATYTEIAAAIGQSLPVMSRAMKSARQKASKIDGFLVAQQQPADLTSPVQTAPAVEKSPAPVVVKTVKNPPATVVKKPATPALERTIKAEEKPKNEGVKSTEVNNETKPNDLGSDNGFDALLSLTRGRLLGDTTAELEREILKKDQKERNK